MRRDYDEITRALAIAAEAHDRQIRKGSATPYFFHPCEVAMLLIEEDQPQKVILAGILHDTLEDTDITPEDLENKFGEEVASLVLEVSETVDRYHKAPWLDRKAETIAKIPKMSKEARIITCADKVCNLRNTYLELHKVGDKVWERFNKGKEEQAWYYTSVLESLRELQGLWLYKELEKYVRLVFDEKDG